MSDKHGPLDDRELLRTRSVPSAWHLSRIEQQFINGFSVIEQIGHPAISIFGSARTPEDNAYYQSARQTAKLLAEAGWAVVTGGGPGVMEAANRGCKEGGGVSVGFTIELPHEQDANPYLDLRADFHNFYARKTMFVKAAEGFVVFPGGFGTFDELFESLTLIQTGKVERFPVVLYSSSYWRGLLKWLEVEVLPERMVSAGDLGMFVTVDSPEEVVIALEGAGRTPEPKESQ